LFFAALALVIANRNYAQVRSPLSHAVLLGIVIFLAYGTRNPALALVPALILYELMRFRRIMRFAAVDDRKR
jgi:hypothetical protein